MSRKPNARLVSLRAEIARAAEAYREAMAQPAAHAEAEMVRRDVETLAQQRAEMLKLPEVRDGGQR